MMHLTKAGRCNGCYALKKITKDKFECGYEFEVTSTTSWYYGLGGVHREYYIVKHLENCPKPTSIKEFVQYFSSSGGI